MHIGSSDRENDFEVVKEIDTLKFTFFTKEGDDLTPILRTVG